MTESLPHPFHALSRHTLLNLVYANDPFCSKAIGLGFESQSSFLSLDHISYSCLAHHDGQNLERSRSSFLISYSTSIASQPCLQIQLTRESALLSTLAKMLPLFYQDTTFFFIPYYRNNDHPCYNNTFKKRTRVVVITKFHCSLI